MTGMATLYKARSGYLDRDVHVGYLISVGTVETADDAINHNLETWIRQFTAIHMSYLL